jgi:hypothetical protein
LKTLAPDNPHSKYPHVYAIVRFDLSIGTLENRATVVKVLASRDLAEEEAARLRKVNQGKQCSYSVQTTRLVGTPIYS